jgi:hypothetical protein
MRGISFKKGQSLTELALLIALVALAFVGMELYARRGIQSRVRSLADNMITGNIRDDGTLDPVRECPSQADYEENTTELNVSESNASFNAAAGTTAKENLGGSRELFTIEDSTAHYEYKSVDESVE